MKLNFYLGTTQNVIRCQYRFASVANMETVHNIIPFTIT